MRIRFQERPWDLVVVGGVTALVSGILLAEGGGNPLSLLLFLFAPGYMVIAAVFPGNEAIGWTERLALSVGLSIAVIPMLALVLSFTAFGIGLPSLVSLIAVFTLGTGALAFARRILLSKEHRLRFAADLPWTRRSDQGLAEKVLGIGLAAAIVFAGAAFAYVLLVPRSGETSTEFFLLGPNGTAADYPDKLNVSEPAAVTMVVVNHETANVSYIVRVDLVGVRVVVNGTTGRNETVEVNRTSLDTIPLALEDGASWIRRYPFTIDAAGRWRLDFLLFRGSDLQTPYRDLHLLVVVGGP